MDRSEQLEFVTGVTPPPGGRRRYNCPSCLGHMTLSVSKPPGKIVWHCFRAGCDMAGSTGRRRTQEELETTFMVTEPREPRTMARPAAWTSALSSEAARDFIRKYNVEYAWTAGHCQLAFDPTLNRLVFEIRNRLGELVDAAGRALGPGTKWHRYGFSGLPFEVCPGLQTAVVVEDCASAAAVAAAGYTGIALLGTELLASHIPAIRKCEQVIVALDPDAALKAVKIAKRLNTWLPARPALLRDDPKYFSPTALKEALDE